MFVYWFGLSGFGMEKKMKRTTITFMGVKCRVMIFTAVVLSLIEGILVVR